MILRNNPAPQFSVDDFERVGTTAWEGVRNHEAKNLMMQMRVGDRVRSHTILFLGGAKGWGLTYLWSGVVLPFKLQGSWNFRCWGGKWSLILPP